MKSFIDSANMAKGLMDENQQLSVQQEFERLFASLQQLMQILVLQHFLLQNRQLQKYGDQRIIETQNKFPVFSI